MNELSFKINESIPITQSETMKSIEITSLSLKNFKGIRDLQISFDPVITNIFGDNATGKTTVNDAFRWLLFDKDSTDRKNFEIKTLNEDNEPIHGLEHSVTGEIKINGKPKAFQKIFKEKWQKKRGEAESQFTGHETLYYINEVPVKQSDYQAEINFLIEEGLFKILTDPLYFSQTMKWQERRSILTKIAKDVLAEDVIRKDDSLLELKPELENYTIEELRKKLSSQIKKLNDDIKAIPTRIDECSNNIKEINSDELKSILQEKETLLKNIEDELLSFSKENSTQNSLKEKLYKLRDKISAIEYDHEKKLYAKKINIEKEIYRVESDLKSAKSEISFTENRIKNLTQSIEENSKQTEQLRNDWHNEKEKPFTISEDFTCPTCKRKLDEEVIEKKQQELSENFNHNKAQRLNEINLKGKRLKEKIDADTIELTSSKNSIEALSIKVKELSKELESLKSEKAVIDDQIKNPQGNIFDYGKEYFELKDEYETLENSLAVPEDTQIRISSLQNNKILIQKEIDQIKKDLYQQTINENQIERIEKLKAEERKLSQQIADIEKKIFLCEKYIRTEASLIESSVNEHFKFVRFKLFNNQINGGLTETCEAVIGGVPFSDANNASKINAGIDIINTLSKHFGVTAPIFIDNRESINDLLPTTAQLINLIVSQDKILRVA